MSANSDTKRLIQLATEHGLTVTKVKHGGYQVTNTAGTVITRIPAGGSSPPHMIKNARRAITAAGNPPKEKT